MKKRQKIRAGVILLSFLLFPVTMFYFSPALIIEGAAQGIIVGSFFIFLAQFGSSQFLGRSFCGWVCPAAGLQEACFKAKDKKVPGGKLDWIKYFIWVPWVSIIAILFYLAGGFQSIRPFYQTTYGISIAEPGNYIVFYFFTTLIVILAFTVGKRAFCHYVCWMAPFMVIGTKIRNLGMWPSLRLKLASEKCKDCLTCSKNCPMSLDINGMVKKGSMVNSECILCGTCFDNCPNNVISFSFSRGNS